MQRKTALIMTIYLVIQYMVLISVIPGLCASPTPALGQQGMVVSQHRLATQIGVDILQAGGNAVDAAVGTALALGVVEAYHSGIGGGGFMLIRMQGQAPVIIDFREVAPAAATDAMYLVDGEPNPALSKVGALACGVPGEVAGLELALRKYGTKSLAEVLQPSIQLARDGFPLSQTDCEKIYYMQHKLTQFPESARIFLKDGQAPLPGDILIQDDLAATYQKLADHGGDSFYRGEIGGEIVKYLRENGGILTIEDLENYQAKELEPVYGSYRGYDIYSMPPPSSGGVHLIQMLNILENFNLTWIGQNSAQKIHLVAEAMKLAFADRSHFLGDPAFVDIPLAGLLSKNYANGLAQSIHPYLAGNIEKFGDPEAYEPKTTGNTSHLSVIDRDGNCVSLTQTVNLLFGNGMIVPGTGIVLNNQMDDFSIQPGVPNAFGLVGGNANAIAPGKRPLSSMTPVIVLKDEQPVLIAGSPGGPRIITTVLQVILNVIDHGMDIQSAVDAPRFHHQWQPDLLFLEPEFPIETLKNLQSRGHQLSTQEHWSSAQCIWIDPVIGWFYGGTDSRLSGKAIGY